jgi:4-hydroxyphenylacetate 3-monooxygenase
VFVAGDIQMCQKQFFATPAHVFQNYQCQIRLMVKMRFLVGLARRIAAANGIENFPPVRETLGQLAAEAAGTDASGPVPDPGSVRAANRSTVTLRAA